MPVDQGYAGPFMVCRECRKPLIPHTTINVASGEEHVNHYLHPGDRVTDGRVELHWDHEAVPVEGDPLTADTVCDFCGTPRPRHAFIPRDVVIHVDPAGDKHRLFSPHLACDGCRQLVRRRDMTRLLDRAVSSPLAVNVPREMQRAYRGMMRGYFTSFFQTRPAGPYEVKIPPGHSPFGRRGSARGA